MTEQYECLGDYLLRLEGLPDKVIKNKSILRKGDLLSAKHENKEDSIYRINEVVHTIEFDSAANQVSSDYLPIVYGILLDYRSALEVKSCIRNPVKEIQGEPGSSSSLKDKIEELERREIVSALDKADNNKAQAARLLGVSRKGLIDRLKRLNMWEA